MQWIYEILQNTIQLPLYADLKRICETEGAKRKVDMKKQPLIFTNTNLLTIVRTEVSCFTCSEEHQATNYPFVIIASNKGWSKRKKGMQGMLQHERRAAFHFSAKPFSQKRYWWISKKNYRHHRPWYKVCQHDWRLKKQRTLMVFMNGKTAIIVKKR